MKRNLTVLVLLVAWSLLSISSLSQGALAGEIPDPQGSETHSPKGDLIAEVNGGSDDGSGGDPGDAGDGYGISDQPEFHGAIGGNNEVDISILDEFMLILASLMQLAL